MKPITSGSPPTLNWMDADAEAPDIESNVVPFQRGPAADPPPHDPMTAHAPPSLGKTRAQVRAELADAKAAGLMTYGEQAYPVIPPGSSEPGKTREQVRAELAQAKASGQVTYGELDYPPEPPLSPAGKTREQVHAELAAAKAAGLVTYGEQEYPPSPRPQATEHTDASNHESLLDKLRNVFRNL